MRFPREQEDIYLALVADLSHTLIPTSIMGVTLVVMDLFVWTQNGDPIFLGAAMLGGAGSLLKIGLMFAQQWNDKRTKATYAYAARWERSHAVATVVVATSIGTVVFAAFLGEDSNIQLLMTALLFGYCAGVVARTAIRPNIANLALILSAGPAIWGASQANTSTHHALATMFLIFMLGAFNTVRHVYISAVRHIGTSLEMASLARNDPLTGLANRLAVREAFRTASFNAQGLIAVYSIDLDGFKGVNDRFGHAAGDTVLVEVAQRLLELVPENAVVARWGGDEFVILQIGITFSGEAKSLADSVVNAIAKPFTLDDQFIKIGASVGFSVDSTGRKFEELLHSADEASYVMKRKGGGDAIGSSVNRT